MTLEKIAMINKNYYLYFLAFLMCLALNSCKTVDKKTALGETIFVVFDTSKFEKKHIDKNPKAISISKYIFSIYDNPKATYSTESITLSYKKYKDFDEMNRNNPVINFEVNQDFLENNKDLFFTNDMMQKIGYDETLKLLQKAKHIFLIDKTEIENKKATIKEVFYINTNPIE